MIFVLSALLSAQPIADRVRVMTFNAENLFDTVHDAGKDDYAFLPASEKRSSAHKARCAALEKDYRREECLDLDWSEKALELKLARAAEAVKGEGPDILVLQEVENSRVLEMLRKRLPPGYGPGILIEGRDRRGIDQAILSRLPQVGKAELHSPELSGGRGILEAGFRLPDGAVLTVFALHLPAPYQPRSERIRALRRLNELSAGKLAVAAGDFNITSAEDASYHVSEKYIKGTWLQAHELGCRTCKGTSYYRADGTWSFLDRILLSKDLVADRDSIRVGGSAGGSDHFPMVLDLVRRPKR